MRLTILYFAALREAVGLSREECEVPAAVVDVQTLRTWLMSRGAPWSEALAATRRVRAAVNQAMAVPQTPLVDGAEVAFFPPVTGG
jgi:molybdopterin synthase sulfur carrier subunit